MPNLMKPKFEWWGWAREVINKKIFSNSDVTLKTKHENGNSDGSWKTSFRGGISAET